jgi:hypothetical protein
MKNDPYNLKEGVTVVVGLCRQRRTKWLGLAIGQFYPESALNANVITEIRINYRESRVRNAIPECPTYADALGMSWSGGKSESKGY